MLRVCICKVVLRELTSKHPLLTMQSDMGSDVLTEQPWVQSTSQLPFLSSHGKLTAGKEPADYYSGLIPHKCLHSLVLIRALSSWLVAKSDLESTVFPVTSLDVHLITADPSCRPFSTIAGIPVTSLLMPLSTH